MIRFSLILLLTFASVAPGTVLAQAGPPGGLVPGASRPGGEPAAPPSASPFSAPPTGPSAPPTPITPGAGSRANSAPIVPAGQVGLILGARYGGEGGAITSNLHWRIFPEKPEPGSVMRVLREDKNPNPVFMLPPGGYIVHVAFGLAGLAKRVQLRSDSVRETFELAAGGVRFDGRVGDTRIPSGQIAFEIYKGSQLEGGEKRPLVEVIGTGEVVLLPEGVYHVVSNYGDGNAVTRADFRVQAGKLTDAAIAHRAARITLKLVSEKGGEAVANTAWSVLTPGGDVIKESIGAFPTVVLSEGEYVVIARNEGRVFKGEFKVETGHDREVEVLGR